MGRRKATETEGETRGSKILYTNYYTARLKSNSMKRNEKIIRKTKKYIYETKENN